ncbi:carboxypeptidase-like regulatory domain-containing protein [Pedobacter sp. GSP4]|uniref:carboxypeptidase-like regulatory domain-containing protein n=1 Tax=Pedobacter sp. GSP4 TaxID=3453716 RepID=UPI003EE847F4
MCCSKILLSLIAAFFFLLPCTQAQKIIKGHVVNEANKAIESVSIYNKEKLIALSDQEGNFTIKIDSLDKGQLLSFSSVGYVTRSVKIDEQTATANLLVKLKDRYVNLEDVHIYAPNFVQTLINDAVKHLADTGVVSKTMLCRQYLVRDGKYKTFAEGLFDLHTDEYKNEIKLHLNGIRRLNNLSKNTANRVKLNFAVDLRFELKSYFVGNLNDNMLSPNNDYEIEGLVEYEGEKCYKIYFNKARNILYKSRNGWIYITADKHLIKGMESNVATLAKNMIWINKQNYSIQNGLSKLTSTYLKCNVVAGLFSEGEPSAEMELLFLNDIDPAQKNSDNFSTFKLRQDFYEHPKKNNAKLWEELYQVNHLIIPQVIVETYKSDKDILEQF